MLRLDERAGLSDDGYLQRGGIFRNLPAGEAYIAPLETVRNGTIVFDGSLAGYGLLTTPVRVNVEPRPPFRGGHRLRRVAARDARGRWAHGRSLAELGIGTNQAATLTGNVLEDEKVIGTIHLAFGTSAGMGGVNLAGVHIDGMVLRPRLNSMMPGHSLPT